MASSKLKAFWDHPAGPKTIHFWAPTAKWVISIANIADFSKPPEKISYPQQIAVTATGLIWSRYSMVITPVRLINIFQEWPGAKMDTYLPPHSLSEAYSSGLFWVKLWPINATLVKNWNLFSVNVAMAGTGIYQIARKLRHDLSSEREAAAVKE